MQNPEASSSNCVQGACLQVGQMDLANASLAAAAAGGALSPSMLAGQGKLVLCPPEMPASGPSMVQRNLMIEQVSCCPGNICAWTTSLALMSGGRLTAHAMLGCKQRLTAAISVQLHRAGAPTTSGGQSTEEMTATEEERLKHNAAAPAQVTAAHSFGSSGKPCTPMPHSLFPSSQALVRAQG